MMGSCSVYRVIFAEIWLRPADNKSRTNIKVYGTGIGLEERPSARFGANLFSV